jgi:D-alanyl-D-alanine dipeptidase
MSLVLVNDESIITYTPQYLEESVYEKLKGVAKKAPGKLILYEGYRSREKQIEMFNEFKKKHPDMTDEQVNKFVAIPEKAVHVTGGAVDVAILGFEGGEYLDFENCKTDLDNPNHKLLCDLMAREGFKNFYNEWWHFEDKSITRSNI